MKTFLHFPKQQIVVLLFFGIFIGAFNTSMAQTWTQLGTDFSAPTANLFGASVSISSDGNITAFGLPGGGASTGNRVQVFSYNGSSWTQKGESIVSSSHGGESISLNADGTVICIGAPQSAIAATNAGIVQVFEFNGTSWQQRGANILGNAIADLFGSAVVISSDGNTIAASGRQDSNGNVEAGNVRVYSYNGTNWIQKGSSIFGSSLDDAVGIILDMDASGNTLITGRANGLNRVFEFDGSNWVQKGGPLVETAPQGISSATINGDGNTIAYGSMTSYGTGQAKVFNYNGTDWIQSGNVINNGGTGDEFGNKVSINNDGSILAIGAREFNTAVELVGAVFVYQFDGIDWNQAGQTVTGPSFGDKIGSVLELSSDGNTYVTAKQLYKSTGYVYRANPLLSLEEQTISKMSLFPNPSKGNFTLNLGSQFENIKLSISNLLGQLILSKSYNSVERIDDLKITNPGIYLINASNLQGISQTLRLIIN